MIKFETNEELAKLFAGSEDWEWFDGMQDDEGWRICSQSPRIGAYRAVRGGSFKSKHYPIRPDLNDRATLRLILERIRTKLPNAYVKKYRTGAFEFVNESITYYNPKPSANPPPRLEHPMLQKGTSSANRLSGYDETSVRHHKQNHPNAVHSEVGHQFHSQSATGRG